MDLLETRNRSQSLRASSPLRRRTKIPSQRIGLVRARRRVLRTNRLEGQQILVVQRSFCLSLHIIFCLCTSSRDLLGIRSTPSCLPSSSLHLSLFLGWFFFCLLPLFDSRVCVCCLAVYTRDPKEFRICLLSRFLRFLSGRRRPLPFKYL